MSYGRELETAVDIAREAATIGVEYFTPERMRARQKGERDVVTEADLEAERLVVGRLKRQFPQDGILGEEGTDTAGTSGRMWCIDPIDGTLNYSRGLPIWCVSLALFEDSLPVIGVIVDPLRGEVFAAARGAGCTVNGTACRTADCASLSDAVVHITIDFEQQSMSRGLDDVRRLAPRVLRTRNIGSAALALAYVAAGRFDGMLHRFAHPWDYGAGALMVREAGGEVTDMAGERYTIGTAAVAAAASERLNQDLRLLLGP